MNKQQRPTTLLCRITISTPHISFLSFCVFHARELAVLEEIAAVIVYTFDDLITFTCFTTRVLLPQEEEHQHGADEANANVHEYNAMTERIPRLVLSPVLVVTRQ